MGKNILIQPDPSKKREKIAGRIDQIIASAEKARLRRLAAHKLRQQRVPKILKLKEIMNDDNHTAST